MHVVVWDPSNEYWEGALVSDEVAAVLRARHVATLPAEPGFAMQGAVGGYFRRGWGAGWPIGTMAPRTHCPMLLRISSGLHTVNWCARLVPAPGAHEAIWERFEQGGRLVGLLRLTPDTGQPGVSAGGFSANPDTAVEVEKLRGPDEWGGWTVGGSASIHGHDGYMAFCLYGTIPGIAVAWAAISQSR